MTAARALNLVIRVCAGGALLLGAAFWAGYGRGLLPLHLALGLTLVLSLCAVAAMSWARGVRSGLGVAVFLSAAVVLLLGFAQTGILLGPLHWIVRLLHLAISVLAAVLGAVLATAVQREGSARP